MSRAEALDIRQLKRGKSLFASLIITSSSTAIASSGFTLFAFLLILCADEDAGGANTTTGKLWCIAKPSADPGQLEQNLKFACRDSAHVVDCSPTLPGGSCAFAQNRVSDASYAMNLYYQSVPQRSPSYCFFANSGLLISEDLRERGRSHLHGSEGLGKCTLAARRLHVGCTLGEIAVSDMVCLNLDRSLLRSRV
ncbi:hypothetical protein NL676_012143 [Syzygium grande]|nr:hypothetical protein NL676_012143 [Syzygium grande]